MEKENLLENFMIEVSVQRTDDMTRLKTLLKLPLQLSLKQHLPPALAVSVGSEEERLKVFELFRMEKVAILSVMNYGKV